MSSKCNSSILKAACAVALGCVTFVSYASPISGAIGEAKPIIDLRVRAEYVDQKGLVDDANAGTIRARLGFETGKAWSTALLAEGSFLTPWVNDYRNDTSVALNTTRPVVADPENYALNRLQLANTSLPDTTITLGRQRINIDDQRFVGNVGWRMNEQTYDALRVVNKSVKNLTFDVTYSNRVNRVFGHDSPQGVYKGDFVFANAAYQFKFGKLTAFSYLLDFDTLIIPGFAALNPARVSTETFGARFAGEKALKAIKLGYVASYAMQDKYGSTVKNPLLTTNASALENDYYLGELSAGYKQFTLLLGYESLGGNGTAGFSTPLATLHKFQGWADKFLTTPAAGIDDRYASFAWNKKGFGPFDTVGLTAVYHDYASKRLTLDQHASEMDLQANAKYQRFNFMLKYADYVEEIVLLSGQRDTRKLWIQMEYVW